ncbi:hypothetical protein GpartN1_g7658.t1 [Galdieria partita]|uniref:ER membrane protein complex subunit 3 n=1 Tax=Galdieria partita TaxID=83374 RepID=A0A9C7Q841_9RHOD|nr:hypothetical protein GpartN1_g7658.t1 [Galdieria partita]
MELVLSGQILIGVLFSITLLSFITVAMRAPLLSLFQTQPAPSLSSIRMAHILKRSVVTRTNGGFVPKDSFLCRKHLFMNESRGLLQQDKEPSNKLTFMMKPHIIRKKVLENIANVGPQMALGAWIRMMFSGYIVCVLPFWVPERFRSMLQSGVEMVGDALDIRYVSGLSWYILNIFGLQSLLVLDEQVQNESPLIPDMQLEMLMKQERELWKGTDHDGKLENIEEELLREEESN